jgi:hypothetical protein
MALISPESLSKNVCSSGRSILLINQSKRQLGGHPPQYGCERARVSSSRGERNLDDGDEIVILFAPTEYKLGIDFPTLVSHIN